MERDPVRNAQKRINAYWFEDGIPEMAGGAVILVLGLTFMVFDLLPKDIRSWANGLGMPFFSLALMFLARQAISRAKEKLTYPRTGYVELRKISAQHRIVVAVLAGLVSMLTIFLLKFLDGNLAFKLPPLMMGLASALFGLFRGLQTGLVRFYFLSAFSFLLGPAILLLGLGYPGDIGVLLAVTGFIWLLSGLLALRGYLRRTGVGYLDGAEQ